jgi:predicted RNA-binding Zn-ribbon protein involved in translation (DUF1610 family)
MAFKEPESMEELAYFTNRIIGDGSAKAWVYREMCPKCKKEKMGKPRDSKGKVKIRADEYLCPVCGFTMKKEEYEDTLSCQIKYTCPKCRNNGETEVPFKRKKVQLFDEEKQKKVSADAVVFNCQKCNEKIAITKKMK